MANQALEPIGGKGRPPLAQLSDRSALRADLSGAVGADSAPSGLAPQPHPFEHGMNAIDHFSVLVRKLATMFPDPAVRERVEDELQRYGLEEHERETPRVRLAILKVAGTGIEQIREWTDIAKRDYRDVLAAAEYPNQLTTATWSLPSSERSRIAAKDAEQYRNWIEAL